MNRNKIIEEAQVLLRKGWTKNHAALDYYGEPTSSLHASACYFCAVGALARAAHDNGLTTAEELTRFLFEGDDVLMTALVQMNDTATSVNDVIDYLEKMKEPA